ncbi:MAG: ABC transporter ATP-binding protein [Alphaproteobacteria bacterium]|nr:ABC transporter ATP-binding protein [Alphaproteobacteria bacterium]
MVEPLVRIKSLHAGYEKTVVVRDVSFEIGAGEIFGLVGLNGAGKTTLIKTILRLREKMSGDVFTENPNQIAYLPEKFDPPWFLTGIKFIQFSLGLYKKKMATEDIYKEAENLSFNTDFLAKSVHKYSKGMRQKLGLLATILSGCRLLVLDEPMSGLDPKARQEVKKMILEVRKEGRSVFMSSHILADISELCDRVAVFHNNTIIFVGSPRELETVGQDHNLEKAFLNLIGDKKAA